MTTAAASEGQELRLPGTEWDIWRQSALRSTGFPVDLVGVLADPQLAQIADDDSASEAEFDGAYAAAWQRLSDAMAMLARDGAFREAITWQSPHLISTCLDKVVNAPDFDGRPPSQHRQKLATLANYVQRYTLKNDSIGFFGPIGWATWTDAKEALCVMPGAGLLARRTVYFEVWAIQELASALLAVPELRVGLPLRRSPENLVTDVGVYTPAGLCVELSPAEVRVLEACDGSATIDQLARRANVDPSIVESLVDRALLLARPEITYSAHPEKQLHQLLTALPDSAARDRALGVLTEILRAKEAIVGVAGSPDELATAMDRLARLFSEATGSSAARHAGQTYMGRTLVYEDTVRDVRVELGTDMVDKIAPALELILVAARWLTWQIGTKYASLFRTAFNQLQARTGQADVALGRLLAAVTPDLVFDRATLPPIVADCVREFQLRWSRILRGLPENAEQYAVKAQDIREDVLVAFNCAGAPWRAARQHSPDIMVAAADAEAVRRGDFFVVLGEMHVGVNTLQSRMFVEQAPDPSVLMAAEAENHGSGRVVSLPSARSRGVASRTYPSALSSKEFTYWTMYPDVAARPGPVVPAGSLMVVDRDGGDDTGLMVVSRADGREWSLFEVVSESLTWMTANSFVPIPSMGGKKPRVQIDSFVISRAGWSVPVKAATWTWSTGAQRYRGARQWRQTTGLPERCFYRLAIEDKPQFVDFTSVALVDVLARGLRRLADADPAARASFSEILPEFGQNWLVDKDGSQYCAEIRIVAVDRQSGS